MTVMKWNKRCIIGISNVKRQQGKIIFNVVIIFISIKKRSVLYFWNDD